jgi:glutathionyl-hydroquinone reductase
MTNDYPKWEEIYNNELTLQALFEKLIDVENRMKDEIFMLEDRIDKLEWELKDNINRIENKLNYMIEYTDND